MKVFLSSMAAGLLLATAAGADPLVLTVEDAVQRALARSEEMQLARAQFGDARGRVREALSQALPQVYGAVAHRRQIDSIFEGFAADSGLASVFRNSPFGAERDWTVELTASQPLFDRKVGAALRGAKFYLRASAAQERETSEELSFRVRAAYYEAAAGSRLVEIAESSLRQSRGHRDQVALYHREGARAEYDLLRAQVDAANQEPEVVAARTERDLALLRLKQLLNLPAEQELELATPLESADGTIAVPALEGAPQQRAALSGAEDNVRAYEQALRVARSERWPTLSLSTTLQHQAFPRGEWPDREEFHRNWDAELRLRFPIFTGFRTSGIIQRAEAALGTARAQRDQLRERVAAELAEARAQLERAMAVLAARRQTVRQATRAHELANVRYTNGLSTQLEVADARLALQTAGVRQVEAARDYLVALAALERALGRPVPVERRPLESLSMTLKTEGSSR